MGDAGLSFVELERRIRALPEGPVAALNTPKWLYAFNAVGTAGIVIGLLPSLLIKFLEPQMWMVRMAQFGVWAAYLGCGPVILRSVWAIGRSMWRWKPELGEQLDHDLAQFHTLIRWLVGFPKELLEEHQRFATNAQTRLAAKLGLLAGSIDKLGAIPIMAALALQLKSYFDPEGMPIWQIMLAIFLAITYLIAWVGAHMRLRVQLYETLLFEALAKKA